MIGFLLVIEAFLPSVGGSGLVPDDAAWRSVSGLLLGIAIGAVAALLGVAGGELLIPTLMFVFGVDIYVAGTAALIISLLMVCVGLWRYHGFGALPDADALVATALPMGMGSILGAILGGILAGIFPALVLKLSLGFILIAAAVGTFGRRLARVRRRNHGACGRALERRDPRKLARAEDDHRSSCRGGPFPPPG